MTQLSFISSVDIIETFSMLQVVSGTLIVWPIGKHLLLHTRDDLALEGIVLFIDSVSHFLLVTYPDPPANRGIWPSYSAFPQSSGGRRGPSG